MVDPISQDAKDGFMAGKPLNRLELRRQNDAAEPLDPMEDEAEDTLEDADEEEATERKAKKKPKAAKPKTKTPKAAKPATRMRIVWSVLNDAFKTVGTFEYAQKEAAEARAAELTAKGKGTHFVQKTKEPMPDNAPGLGAAIPRTEVAEPKAALKKAAIEEEEEEEIEEEEETEAEAEADVEEEEAEAEDEE
jgi:hypothetical protein